MEKAPDNYRYERKFALNGISIHEILDLVKFHPAIFTELYPPRFVNNIYFDSLNRDSYYDTLDGVAQRVKVRIRWYGGLFGFIAKPILELKIRKGLLGTKQSRPLAPFSLDNTFNQETLQQVLADSQLDEFLHLHVALLNPSLINRYYRYYFQSFDGAFRITIDTGMEFYPADTPPHPDMYRFTDYHNTVLELKYDPDNSRDASHILNAFPFRMTKNSKYTNGMDCLAF